MCCLAGVSCALLTDAHVGTKKRSSTNSSPTHCSIAWSLGLGELGTPPSRITGFSRTVSSAVMALVCRQCKGGEQLFHVIPVGSFLSAEPSAVMPMAAHAGQSDNNIERDICVRRTHSGRSCSLPQRCPGSLPHLCRDACFAFRYQQQCRWLPLPPALPLAQRLSCAYLHRKLVFSS